MPGISIIIPAKNEEKRLPLLLDSILKQENLQCCGGGQFTAYEVIVADGGSTDKTVEIAKQYGCKVIQGGTPAQGRNRGAQAADYRTTFLLFLDADVVLQHKNTLSYLLRRKPHFALSYVKALEDGAINDMLLEKHNIMQNNNLLGLGAFMWVSKAMFNKVGGFREDLKIGEDGELSYRIMAHTTPYIMPKEYFIYISARRYRDLMAAMKDEVNGGLRFLKGDLDKYNTDYINRRQDYEIREFTINGEKMKCIETELGIKEGIKQYRCPIIPTQGGGWHVHLYPDGSYTYHYDRFDPRKNPILHALYDVARIRRR